MTKKPFRRVSALLILVFMGCSSNSKNQTTDSLDVKKKSDTNSRNIKNDASPLKKDSILIVDKNASIKEDSDVNNVPKHSTISLIPNLNGRWCPLKNKEASFSIEGSEIFYYDATASYKISVENGKIHIYFDDYKYDGNIRLIGKDTLIMAGIDKFKGHLDTLYRCI